MSNNLVQKAIRLHKEIGLFILREMQDKVDELTDELSELISQFSELEMNQWEEYLNGLGCDIEDYV